MLERMGYPNTRPEPGTTGTEKAAVSSYTSGQVGDLALKGVVSHIHFFLTTVQVASIL